MCNTIETAPATSSICKIVRMPEVVLYISIVLLLLQRMPKCTGFMGRMFYLALKTNAILDVDGAFRSFEEFLMEG